MDVVLILYSTLACFFKSGPKVGMWLESFGGSSPEFVTVRDEKFHWI